MSKMFGGAFAFLWATLVTSFRYKPHPVRLQTDTGFDEVLNVGVCAVSNGKFFGGGMKIAPDAEPDDGLFDIVIMRDTTFLDMLRAKSLITTPIGERPVLLDVDGEAPGRLAAKFDIMPQAITLRC